MSEESLKSQVISDNSFDPKLAFICSKERIQAKFKGNSLTQDVFIFGLFECSEFIHCL